MIQSHFQKPERIEILHLRLGAEFFRSAQPHADVGIAAQMALLHVAAGNFDVLQDLLQLGQERERFVGTANIRLGDDLN